MANFLTIEIKGAEQLIAALERMNKYFRTKTREALLLDAIKVEGMAKGMAPVDTGRLRSSITHRIDEDTYGIRAVVGSAVKYASFVEFGSAPHLAYVDGWPARHGYTRDIYGARKLAPQFIWVSGKAQPYLIPALNALYSDITKSIVDKIEEAIKEA